MPIYEYHCSGCDTDFEMLVKVRAPNPPCPKCGSEDVAKQVSAAGFILKGGGWYKDHYGLKSGGSSDKGGDTGSSSTTPAASTPKADGGSSGGESAGSKAKAISKAAASSGE